MKKIHIILGSTRQQRFGEVVAQWLLREAKTVVGLDVELVDLRELALPFFDEPKPPSALQELYSHPAAQRWSQIIKSSDDLVFVTPEYNHSYPAVVKNAVDYLASEWKNKPYVIVSYSPGPIGGARAAMQLRGLLDYMGARCHGEMNMTFASKHFDETGKLMDEQWAERAHKLLSSLVL